MEHFSLERFNKIYMVTKVPVELSSWWQTFDGQDKETIKEKLGRLVDVLNFVQPNRDLVQALIPFWCPTRAVFKFKGFELTPTLGEIVGITGLPCRGREMIFPNSQSGIAFLHKLGLKKVETLGCIKNNWVYFDYLYKRFGFLRSYDDFHPEFQCEIETWYKRRVRAFIIAFLGTLVFPEKYGHIRTCIGSVVHVMFDGIGGNNSVTLVPMILAEMYRALNACREGSNYFEGCNLLLQLWAIEQVCYRDPERDTVHIRDHNTGEVNPVTTQRRRTRDLEKPKNFLQWYSYLDGLDDKQVMWRLRYVPDEETVLRTSNRYYIELAGLTGLQPYAPLRVLRQFGIEQVIPLCADMSMSKSDFNLNKKIPRKEEISTDWINLQPVELPMKRQISCTPEYLAWIRDEQHLGPSLPGRVGYEDTNMTKKMKHARAGSSRGGASTST